MNTNRMPDLKMPVVTVKVLYRTPRIKKNHSVDIRVGLELSLMSLVPQQYYLLEGN